MRRETFHASRRVRRGGISLVEVLIAIGVVAIGLLGVAALLPLAHHKAEQGVQQDRRAAAGKRAFREFRVRGMGNPANWRTSAGAAYAPAAGASFCIDPRGLANGAPVTFGGPAMDRVTLFSGLAAVQAMSGIQADTAFVIEDDLQFDIPTDPTLPPRQIFTGSPGADGQWGDATIDDDGDTVTDNITEAGWPGSDDEVKRYADGRFSWMVTLVPDTTQATPFYTLSVVIFDKRVFPPQEVVASVGFPPLPPPPPPPVALGGGPVTLNAAVPLNVREGEWVMLGQTRPSGQRMYKWYRVLATDNRAGQNTRSVTLQGPDWPVDAGVTTEAVYAQGAVAVYEKTIRVETSSLWTN